MIDLVSWSSSEGLPSQCRVLTATSSCRQDDRSSQERRRVIGLEETTPSVVSAHQCCIPAAAPDVTPCPYSETSVLRWKCTGAPAGVACYSMGYSMIEAAA